MIDIITLTFNNHPELLRTLRSLEGSGVNSIVINGGRDAETNSYLKTKSFTHVSEPDEGIADAFNKGVRLSQSSIISFLNSGDVLLKRDYYSLCEKHFEDHPDCDFIHANVLFKDRFAGDVVLKPGGKLPDVPFHHPTLVVRKSLFERIGSFDKRYKSAMDLDFFYRMKEFKVLGHYVDEIVVEMDGSGISSQNFTLYLKEKFQVALSHKDFTLHSFYSLSRLVFSFGVRKTLLSLGMSNVIGAYRRRKHK